MLMMGYSLNLNTDDCADEGGTGSEQLCCCGHKMMWELQAILTNYGHMGIVWHCKANLMCFFNTVTAYPVMNNA